MPQLALPEEIAELFGVSRKAVVVACKSGKLPAVKVCNRWLVHLAMLTEQLEREGTAADQ
jgi:excisionase family DNA binding protein